MYFAEVEASGCPAALASNDTVWEPGGSAPLDVAVSDTVADWPGATTAVDELNEPRRLGSEDVVDSEKVLGSVQFTSRFVITTEKPAGAADLVANDRGLTVTCGALVTHVVAIVSWAAWPLLLACVIVMPFREKLCPSAKTANL
jgi:hypothetical protein